MDHVTADPASVIVSLGALVGLLAARYWWLVSVALQPDGEGSRGFYKMRLGTASALTSIAISLVSVGYLLGRYTGRF